MMTNKRGSAMNTVKGSRRWLRTSARNRARDWRKRWLRWRAQKYEDAEP